MILHVFNSSIVSGPETLVFPALKELGGEAEILVLKETRKGEIADSVPRYARELGLIAHVIEVRSRYDFGAILKIRAFLAARNDTIIHTHGAKPSLFVLNALLFGAKNASGKRVYLVATNHGIRANKSRTLALYETIYARVVLPFFNRVLSVCSSDAEILKARGLDATKVRVHLNGVDRREVVLNSRASVQTEIRRSWSDQDPTLPSEGAILLGVVGRLAPEKRYDRILKSFKHLTSEAPELNAHLVCFGSGPFADSLKVLTREMGLDQRVHWMGYRNTIGNESAGFDALLSFSDAEGLPINLIEAGWSATPVIATAVDGNLDLIEAGVSGVLFDRGLSERAISGIMVDFLKDRGRQIQIGAAFQQRVKERFSQGAWLNRLRSIYGELEVDSQ